MYKTRESREKAASQSLQTGVIRIHQDGSYMHVEQDGAEVKLQKTKITLNDCLACSGCITSAESVLITQQSQDELYRILDLNHNNKKLGLHSDVKVIVVSVSPQSRASLAAKFKLTLLETAKRLTGFFKKLGCNYVFDTTFARDFSLLESQHEFVRRFRSKNKTSLPMLASACPGWVCYAEKTHGNFILPFISTTKSPQQIMGSLVKHYFSSQLDTTADKIYHVTVMPCYDKKLEASREDFYNDILCTRDVDCVISTGEVELMLQKEGVTLLDQEPSELDDVYNSLEDGELVSHSGGGSGGYLHHIARYAAKELYGQHLEQLNYKTLKNEDFKEILVEHNGNTVLRFAIAYGFRNIQNLVLKLKRKKCPYDFVEVMACPSGCLNGGGQIRPEDSSTGKEHIAKLSELYNTVRTRLPENNSVVNQLYEDWLDGADSEKAHRILHTSYHVVEKIDNVLNIKW